jgi:hypothetical protein
MAAAWSANQEGEIASTETALAPTAATPIAVTVAATHGQDGKFENMKAAWLTYMEAKWNAAPPATRQRFVEWLASQVSS